MGLNDVKADALLKLVLGSCTDRYRIVTHVPAIIAAKILHETVFWGNNSIIVHSTQLE